MFFLIFPFSGKREVKLAHIMQNAADIVERLADGRVVLFLSRGDCLRLMLQTMALWPDLVPASVRPDFLEALSRVKFFKKIMPRPFFTKPVVPVPIDACELKESPDSVALEISYHSFMAGVVNELMRRKRIELNGLLNQEEAASFKNKWYILIAELVRLSQPAI